MYSKEESKALREEFWNQFKKMSGTWLLSNTGIKALNLRFHVDREVAQVGIDLETKNMDKRLELFEKMNKLEEFYQEFRDFFKYS